MHPASSAGPDRSSGPDMTSAAALEDPDGLLDRIPLLAPLCSDRWVRRAVASGNPLRVYRSLFLARLTGRLRAHRSELAELLATRRRFARPLRKRLYLGSWDGLGSGFIGSAERQEDGTRIATHVLEFLFGVPVWPLGAYVVRNQAPRGLHDRWTIFAQVPLGPFAWAWSRGLILAGIVLVGMALWP